MKSSLVLGISLGDHLKKSVQGLKGVYIKVARTGMAPLPCAIRKSLSLPIKVSRNLYE